MIYKKKEGSSSDKKDKFLKRKQKVFECIIVKFEKPKAITKVIEMTDIYEEMLNNNTIILTKVDYTTPNHTQYSKAQAFPKSRRDFAHWSAIDISKPWSTVVHVNCSFAEMARFSVE